MNFKEKLFPIYSMVKNIEKESGLKVVYVNMPLVWALLTLVGIYFVCFPMITEQRKSFNKVSYQYSHLKNTRIELLFHNPINEIIKAATITNNEVNYKYFYHRIKLGEGNKSQSYEFDSLILEKSKYTPDWRLHMKTEFGTTSIRLVNENWRLIIPLDISSALDRKIENAEKYFNYTVSYVDSSLYASITWDPKLIPIFAGTVIVALLSAAVIYGLVAIITATLMLWIAGIKRSTRLYTKSSSQTRAYYAESLVPKIKPKKYLALKFLENVYFISLGK